jgi:hypothetical protein
MSVVEDQTNRLAGGSRMMHRIALALTGAVAAILSIAACYEALEALRILPAPRQDRPPLYETAAVGSAILALALAGLLLLAALGARSTPLIPVRLLAYINGAAASFVVARFFSYDPYYAPTLRRMSDGIVAGWWIVLLTVFAAGAGWAVFRSPRIGTIITAFLLWMCAFTALVSGLGH